MLTLLAKVIQSIGQLCVIIIIDYCADKSYIIYWSIMCHSNKCRLC